MNLICSKWYSAIEIRELQKEYLFGKMQEDRDNNSMFYFLPSTHQLLSYHTNVKILQANVLLAGQIFSLTV